MMLMGSIYAAIVLTVLLAGVALAPLVQSRFSGRWLGRLCLVLFVWALAVFHVHTANPRRHRLFMDEDAYANISRNLTSYASPSLTVAFIPAGKVALPYKWPGGFPSVIFPFIRLYGAETGPALTNELVGGLTLALVMWFAARLAADWKASVAAACFWGLQPLVIPWYRSGSSEPLATLFLLISLYAGAECRLTQRMRSCWPVIAVLTALLAVHTRLENVLVFIPLVILLWGRMRTPSWAAISAIPVCLALATYFVLHVTGLRTFYLSGLPESNFSLKWAHDTLSANVQFLLEHGASIVALGVVSAIWAAVRGVRPQGDRSFWRVPAVLLAFTGLMFALLLFYSVGQYRYGGGTRFLLLPAAILSVLSGAALCDLVASRGTRWIAAAILLGLVIGGAGKPDPVGTTTASPQREHDAVERWVPLVPANAIVISRAPFLWEDFGRFSVTPEYAQGKQFGGSPVYFHFGLATSSDEWPAGMMPLDRVITADGAICLFRLR
jgi:hypothetical protein